MAKNKNRSYEIHDFYCIRCGHKAIPLPRPSGKQRELFHKKKLYCLYCQKMVNHIEVRNEEDKAKFLEDFNDGVYREEAECDFIG